MKLRKYVLVAATIVLAVSLVRPVYAAFLGTIKQSADVSMQFDATSCADSVAVTVLKFDKRGRVDADAIQSRLAHTGESSRE
jgi:hypothetical protein